MADRQVKVTLNAQVQGYLEGMEKAAKATRETGSEADKLAQKKQAFETLGRGAMIAGTAVAAGLLLSTKAAIDWESAWAGVTKTVDGTDTEMAELEGQLRSMTSVLPATHAEIAAVAEAAGQLGIKRESVAAFTRTMIDLGETTNLSAEEAATSLARFTNIMGTSQGEVSNLGSAIVDLGNSYATTEAEILEMSMRLAGAGKQIGMSEGEVLGLSAALSSVGIAADAGGSAMSKVMIDIASSVDKGGDRLELFAKVSGVSADSFASKWKTDPGAALALFVEGLANAEAQGSSTLGVLEEMGITEVRMRDALLRSASASDQFTAAMGKGNEAFEENTALAAEAEKRYETTAAQLSMMGNSFMDTAITVGQTFLPAVEAGANALAEFAGFIGGMPEPLITVVAWIGAVGAAALLSGGLFVAAVPKIAAYQTALSTLGVTAQRTGALIGMVGKAAGIAGVAYALILAADAAFEWSARASGAAVDAEELAKSLSKSGGAAEALSRSLTGQQFDLGKEWNTRIAVDNLKALDTVFGNLQATFESSDLGNVVTKITSLGLGGKLGQTTKNIEELDAALSQMVASGDADKAAKAQANFAEMAEEAGWSVEQIAEALPGYTEALEAAGDAAEDSADGAKSSAEAYVEAADQANALASELMNLLDSYNELNGIGQSAEQANAKLQSSFASLQEYIAKAQEGTEGYALSLDESTEAGSANRAMLADHANSVLTNAQAQFELESATLGAETAAANYEQRLATGRQQIYDTALALTGNADAAQALTDKILAMPSEKEVQILMETAAAQRSLDNFITLNSGKTIRIAAGLGGSGGQVLADGGIFDNGVKAFANSGFEPGIYPYTPGGIHKFAEEFGESYISLDPARRTRSVGVWQETGERLGMMQGIRDALNGGGRGGGTTTITQKNDIHLYDRDERTVMKRVNRSLMEAVNS